MEYSTLGIMMHKKCTAECEICSVECSPHCSEELDEDEIKRFISSCKNTTIKKVSFTGGEPFIRYEVLVSLIIHCKNEGFIPTTVTNGYWATTYEIAYKKLKMLKDCGLARLNVSYDHYHAKYVNKNNIVNIVKACNRLNLPFNIALIKRKGENVGDIIDSFDDDCGVVNFLTAPCEPTGNAKKNFNDDSFIKNIENNHMICPYNGIITLFYDGNIYPCCSHYIFGTKLTIGNYKNLDMTSVLDKIRNNGLLYLLRNHGFDPILNMDIERAEIPRYLSSPCEACQILFADGVSKYSNSVKNYICDMKKDRNV